MSEFDVAGALAAFRAALAGATTPAALDVVRRQHSGKKSPLKAALKTLRQVPPERRKDVAAAINTARATVEAELEVATASLAARVMAQRLEAERMDLTMPGLPAVQRGARHPLTEVEQRCLDVMYRLGFTVVDGPEVESTYYCFDALNIPKHHPARDMQDTFYVDGELVLRTHTTSVQARELSKSPELPVRIVSMGRVYRNEAVDATHLAMFHQFEGVWVEPGLTFAHLKGVLAFIVEELFGKGKMRFKPKFYPYTEPSIGVDLATPSGEWITVLGAGMIHPKLLIQFGYDPDAVSGIAFGLGTTRMASQKVGLDTLKPLYDQELPLLSRLYRGPLS